MKPLLVSSGEPAGIGPDICLSLAKTNLPVVILGDLSVLECRARELKEPISFHPYSKHTPLKSGSLSVLSVPCEGPVVAGRLNPKQAPYVLELLTRAAALCAAGHFSALVTAPIHKANINAAGVPFTGHTEFFADYFKAKQVVMMLACQKMRVALVTTHLPLRQVPDAINEPLIIKVITQLHDALIHDFGIARPQIRVAGLNPHAGESGYLGTEEQTIITPALEYLRAQGLDITGPFPADTMFADTAAKACDAFVAMYHDQGLPVLKYAGFGQAVNVTLGLPIIRTSVDHGTALELAGTNKADAGSLLAAVAMAQEMAQKRLKTCA